MVRVVFIGNYTLKANRSGSTIQAVFAILSWDTSQTYKIKIK